MSKEGRNNIVQSCYLGRFRYYLYFYEMSKKYINQIEKDQNYLIWKKDPDMRVSDTEKKFRRWIPKNSENRARRRGGAGIMPWKRHTQAFYSDWIKRYLHPGSADWKEIASTQTARPRAAGPPEEGYGCLGGISERAEHKWNIDGT